LCDFQGHDAPVTLRQGGCEYKKMVGKPLDLTKGSSDKRLPRIETIVTSAMTRFSLVCCVLLGCLLAVNAKAANDKTCSTGIEEEAPGQVDFA
jgi:hypothetical protein